MPSFSSSGVLVALQIFTIALGVLYIAIGLIVKYCTPSSPSMSALLADPKSRKNLRSAPWILLPSGLLTIVLGLYMGKLARANVDLGLYLIYPALILIVGQSVWDAAQRGEQRWRIAAVIAPLLLGAVLWVFHMVRGGPSWISWTMTGAFMVAITASWVLLIKRRELKNYQA